MTKLPRGTVKSFREYLNAKYPGADWRNGRYHQKTTRYGDYLYAQDREMFRVLLAEAIAGDAKFTDWRKP